MITFLLHQLQWHLKSRATRVFVYDLLNLTTKETSTIHISGPFLRGNHRRPVESHHKRPVHVLWNVFPCHDVKMVQRLTSHLVLSVHTTLPGAITPLVDMVTRQTVHTRVVAKGPITVFLKKKSIHQQILMYEQLYLFVQGQSISIAPAIT